MQKLFKIGKLLILLWFLFFMQMAAWTVQAEDLQIEPSSPVLEVGQSMNLLVSGASGIVTWTTPKGQIESTGTAVTYVAPEKAGTDVVTVFDGVGNIGTIQITVMPASKRAAILIHANAQGNGYNQQQTVDFMASYAYRSLQARDYKDDDIYLLSYKPDLDINNDSQADSVVDAPVNLTAFQNGTVARDLTVVDVQAAFNWAKAKGKLSHPLMITFVGHGLSNQLFLDSAGNKTLTSAVFKTILDDYQKETGNQILVILEASYSGTFVPTLAATDRVIVSSTANNLVYYKNLGRASFLKLYFDELRNGENFWQAWQTVSGKLSAYMPPFNQQNPQLDDANAGSLAQGICLNGCFGGLPGVLTLRVEKLPPIVPLDQPINLNVSTQFSSSALVHSVTVTILKPAMPFNRFGHPKQPPLVIEFKKINNRRRNSQEQWQAQVSREELSTPGTYRFFFNAIDDQDFSADDSDTSCVESCDSSRLINISTRAAILGGDNDVIAGFIITGTGTQKVIIRGLSLEAGVDPKLTVHQYPSGDLLASNDNWQTDPRVGEIPAHLVLPNPIDAGVLLDLPVGAYTAILSSGGAKGLGLISVDEVESNSTTKLTNISTRASIEGGANDVIAGLIITGTGSQKVMIRGLALESGVNPKLTLQKYPGGEAVASNDNWQTDSRSSEIPEHMKLQSPTDAGFLLDLPVGAYTAILSSVGAKGLGLVGVDAID